MITLYHMGFYQPYFQESKVWIQYYQNPSFGDKILTIQNFKIPCDPYKIHTQSSFHTKNPKFHTLACLILAPPSSSLLLLFSFSFTFCSFFPNETNFWSLNPCLLRPCLALQKPIFGLSFIICKKVPPCLTICISSSQICILAHSLFNLCLLSPFLDQLQNCPYIL